MIGPDRDIPGPDLGTDEQTMAWMMDTYSQQVGHPVPGVVTGKPIEIGGSLGRRESTGRGVVTCMVEAARHLGLGLAGARVVVQGYGQVGGTAARLAASMGTKVVAVSDVQGGIHDSNGLDLSKVDAWIREHRSLAGFPGVDHVTNHEILELPCDVLIPAAIQNQITVDNAAKLQCRLLVEGANGPTTLEADDILRDRGVFTVPDIVANAGGVTVSYFEWVQDGQQLFWTEEEVNNKLISIMQRAFRDVLHVAVERKLDMRTAALIRGLTRVASAKKLRGVFP
jgi:glutamate dehydrogenase (NAD(P)+)